MAYVTAQEIVDRYGLEYLSLPSDKNEDGLPDLVPINLAIEDAEAEINKFISSAGYEVPIADVDTNPLWKWIQRCCADLTVYYLSATSDSMTELIQNRRDECMEQLKAIAAGDLAPGGPAIPTQNSAAVVSNARTLRRVDTCEVI